MALAALRELPEASVVVFDDQLRYVLVAGEAVRQQGYDAAALEGQSIAEVLPADRWAFWEPLYRSALHGDSNSVEIKGRDDEHWYRVDVGPWRDERMSGGLAVARDITERRRAQERVANLLDSAPDAMVVVDSTGDIVLVNAQTERLFGYRREDLLGGSIDRLLARSAVAEHAELRRHLAAEPAPRGLQAPQELQAVRADGTELPVEASLSLLETEGGQLISTALRDVTERNRLQGHAAHLAAVVDSSDDAIISTSLDGTILSWNPGAERLYGYAEDEVVGRSVGLLVPAEYADDLAQLLQDVSTGARVGHHETRRRRKDGSLVDVVFTLSALRDAHGRVVGTSNITRDITADKAAREALAQARKDIDRFFDLALDLMVIAGPDGRFTRVNQAIITTLGYTVEELTSQPFTAFVHPDDVQITLDAFGGLADGQSVPSFQNRYRCKDGTYRWLQWSSTAVEDGKLFATAHDVTDQIEMEDELRASREQALEASRLKSEFVANMSHEIRTPLNGVVSMAELLLNTELSGEQREYAQVAMTSAEALMRVINDILDFSKIEAGKLDIVAEDFSVRAAVDEVAEIVGIRTLERGIELEVTVDDAVADVVTGDANRVRQVLMNLLSNATKFTSEGRVTVEVSVEEDDEAPQLRVDVADTGIGIDPHRLHDLFQPFSQQDATTTRRYGGTGLGLCISKQLVELMGGHIGCDSTPGTGSRFWFTVPYQPGGGDVVDGRADLTGTRVLIVAGDADERQRLESRLASWGISPDCVGDGLAALACLRRAADAGRPFETALIENGMTGMDGMELARAITSVPALRSTRLIMLCDEPIDPAHARAAGVHDQLLKPIRQSRLYNQLLSTLYRGRGGAPAISPATEPSPAAAEGRRVLVAEDNQVNQFAAIRLLQTLGFSVDVAQDGREAITMSGRRSYAAIFMDCQMPNVDGYTATRVIRRREQGGARTPIVALTAHALDGDREKCLAAGMDDYVAKPLRLQTVEALIERLPALSPPGGDDHPQDPVFDPAALREIGDPETEAALAMLFLDQAAQGIPALLDAIEAPDPHRIHVLAHGLKGSAATVGANRMSELAQTLCEIAQAAGDLAPASEVHRSLATALGETRAALDTYIADTGE